YGSRSVADLRILRNCLPSQLRLRCCAVGSFSYPLGNIRFDKVGCLPCQSVEQLKVFVGSFVGCAPMGGHHPDDISAMTDQRRGLAGVNTSLKIHLLIFGTSHEVATRYVWRDYPLLFAQRDSAGTVRVCAYPLPKLGGFGVESTES